MRKKSVQRVSEIFNKKVKEIMDFLDQKNLSSLSETHVTWAYDYAIIRLYREFENMILECLIAAINNDTKQLSKKTGISFPKHLTDGVCTYIVVGEGYFDFRGRDGLIGKLKKYLPDDHYLVKIVKKEEYKGALEKLPALRNFAAHHSGSSKKSALKAIGGEKIASSGSWLKIRGRFQEISTDLTRLADEIKQDAPY